MLSATPLTTEALTAEAPHLCWFEEKKITMYDLFVSGGKKEQKLGFWVEYIQSQVDSFQQHGIFIIWVFSSVQRRKHLFLMYCMSSGFF